MFNLMSLLIAAAVVSQLCILECTARQISNKNTDLNYALRARGRTSPRRFGAEEFVKITSAPKPVEHLSGITTVLECHALGRPAPRIVWMKNGQRMPEFEQQADEMINRDRTCNAELISRLIVTAPSNGDVFTCVATSAGLEDSVSMTLLTDESDEATNALEQLFDFPMEPMITTFFNTALQVYESSMTLPCRVKSITDAQVYWLDNDGKPVVGNPRFKVLPSGDLYISKLIWSDMGDFTCVAKNMYGKDSAETFVYPVKSEDNMR